ncbi:MAG: hypothetical protein ABJ263_15070 [Tateyamaria sp.]|uniref:hypothetical protein n=2 Tax=Tateyamaria sp. TaxID=1929288 RepID=UPI0032680875
MSDSPLDQVTAIKIDVEGYDKIALEQILDTLPDHSQLEMVAFEYDPAVANLWNTIKRARSLGFEVYLLQGTYDLQHYVLQHDLGPLARLNAPPTEFSDVLFLREPMGVSA